MILSLDTTSEYGSLALTGGSGTVAEVAIHAPEGFGHILFEEVAGLLARAGVKLADIACFAATSGPGSFTGVRVGLAAVKGLAEALNKPVVAVSNLQALAWFGTAPLRATVLDARRGEIYGAVYDARLALVQPETVMKQSAWTETLPASGAELVEMVAGRVLAGAVGRIAWDRWRAGLASDPATVDANYVRRSDAELFWKE